MNIVVVFYYPTLRDKSSLHNSNITDFNISNKSISF